MGRFEYGKGWYGYIWFYGVVNSFTSSTPINIQKISLRKIRKRKTSIIIIGFACLAEKMREIEEQNRFKKSQRDMKCLEKVSKTQNNEHIQRTVQKKSSKVHRKNDRYFSPLLTAWKICSNGHSVLKVDQKLIKYLTNFTGYLSCYCWRQSFLPDLGQRHG